MNARSLICVVAFWAAACDSPTAPDRPEDRALGRQIETQAFLFRFSANDTVDVSWQEAYHQWATAALEVTVPRRIVYNKYLSREHMGEQNGHANTNAYADPDRFEIHTIWPRDNHEVVHLYASGWGRPVALWSEGLAVAYQTDPGAGSYQAKWNGVALDERARQFLAQGRLLPIQDLLTTAGFRRFDPEITYPQAGSLMTFVIRTCGLSAVKRLFATGTPGDGADAVTAQFESACGRPIADVEAEWRAMLAGSSTGDQR